MVEIGTDIIGLPHANPFVWALKTSQIGLEVDCRELGEVHIGHIHISYYLKGVPFWLAWDERPKAIFMIRGNLPYNGLLVSSVYWPAL